MVAVNTVVEVNRDGAWVPGVVIEESTYRLVVALNGEHSHRAYIARITANWRTVPKNANHARDPQRRKALKQAHNIFARHDARRDLEGIQATRRRTTCIDWCD